MKRCSLFYCAKRGSRRRSHAWRTARLDAVVKVGEKLVQIATYLVQGYVPNTHPHASRNIRMYMSQFLDSSFLSSNKKSGFTCAVQYKHDIYTTHEVNVMNTNCPCSTNKNFKRLKE